MVKLNEKRLEQLKAQPMKECPLCGQTVREDYCEECDLFFQDGHSNFCKLMEPSPYGSDDHRRCWTALREPIIRLADDGMIFFTPEQIRYSPKFRRKLKFK